MKHLCIILNCIIALVLLTSAGQIRTMSDLEILTDAIRNESVLDIVKSNKSIVYYNGGRMLAWAVAYQDSCSYSFITGVAGDKPKRYKQEKIDTLSLIKNYQDILNWGMDSLSIQAKSMTPVYPNIYNPFENGLFVVENGNVVFHKRRNISEYTGMDEESFNSKLGELTFVMWYLAYHNMMDLTQPPLKSDLE